MEPTRQKHFLPDLVLLLAAFVWGTTFALVKASLDYTTPFMFMTMRFTLALVIMTAVVAPQLGALSHRELVGGVLTGGALFFGFTCQPFTISVDRAASAVSVTSCTQK